MKKPIKVFLWFLGSAVILSLAIGFTHNVSKTISKEDRNYIHKIVMLQGYEWEDLTKYENFEDELKDIRAIQRSVLKLTPLQKQVPNNRTRNPKDLYEPVNYVVLEMMQEKG